MKDTEQRLINLYNSSKDSNPENALHSKSKIEFFEFCLKIIDIFTESDHGHIFKQLYFSFENLETCSVTYMAGKTHVDVRTEGRYRNKYCKVSEAVFEFIEKI